MTVINKLGSENVVQIITASAAANIKACALIRNDYHQIYHTRCASHCLDLFIEDWSKLYSMFTEDSLIIVNFFNNNNIPLELLNKSHTKV
ncbi:hypothetical protein A3Q56_07888 [Intoshia linei]|uniref:DUF659 domain-containing protein n=1 Tax=Intoshia linei TaxID=1819745 RepID=A0A177AT31_9BILA|nr:hypothetical protein A3Q56_07888 [Intoshia linei]